MTVQLLPLAPEQFDAWRSGTRERLIRLRQDSGARPGQDAVDQADQYFEELLSEGLQTASARISRIVDDANGDLGTVWLGLNATRLFVVDLAFAREVSEAQNDDLMAAVLAVARDAGVTSISMGVFPQDAGGHRFLAGRGFSPSSIQMLLDPIREREPSGDIEVVRMAPERFERFTAESLQAFAQDLVDSGRLAMDEAQVESRRQFEKELPQGLATPGQALFVGTVDGAEIGILWIGLRERDGHPHAFILDIEVAADQRRRGYGRQLMLAAESEARREGAASIGLHVFGFNHGAVALYEELGYRRTEELFIREL
ncbi:GNAT family N-acetyltransferase [Microbacterium sp. NPDC087665]|uniref:GNAT family N-acetyltransferase n=1 Tax=Microbacterium sp. NPDC087665 TaxID=3364194 RepID=UPI0038231D05